MKLFLLSIDKILGGGKMNLVAIDEKTEWRKDRHMDTKRKKEKHKTLEIWKARYLYLLLLPSFVWLLVFCYGPMYGVFMAFVDYKAKYGVFGSKFVGLDNFRRIFSTPDAVRSIVNTIEISVSRLIITFPIPIILAILFNEMPGKRIKKVYQTVFTFPHFLSWVILSNILINFLASTGAVNSVIQNLGFERINFLGNPKLFRPLLYITDIWKEAGWSAIIYMAAIAGIDMSLYDAAKVDGANRLQQIWHVTLPGIKTTIVVLFILAVGGLMNAGFDQIFNLRNDVVKSAGQIIDSYVYDITFLSKPDYSFSTAIGLFKSVINFVLLLIANKVVALFNEGQGMFK